MKPLVVETKCEAVAATDDDEPDLARLGLRRGSDGLITWLPDSRDHPRNWSRGRKTFDIGVIIFFEFFVYASVARAAQREYNLSQIPALLAFTFMYNLGQSLAGLLTPPLSERFGRKPPYLVSSALFSLSCLVVAGVHHPGAVWTGRFLAGFCSAVPAVVTAGSIEDMFDGRERVWLVVVWNAGSTAGLCLGPVYASFLLRLGEGWRVVFWTAAGVTAVCFLGLCFVRESRPSCLLRRKIDFLRVGGGAGTGTGEGRDMELDWFDPDRTAETKSLVRLVLVQPLRLLFTEPIVAMVTLISAVSWGIVYLFTESLPAIYGTLESGGFVEGDAARASLVFLAFLPGIGLSFLPRLWDRRVVARRLERGERIEPEDKITGFILAAPALAIGLAWFAWTVPPFTQLHWLVPTAALIPIGFAVNEMAYTLAAYLTDAYLLYAASAFCGLAFVRALVSGLMPLVAQQMYPALGANIAGSVVAGAALVFCLAPWVFCKYGRRLRERSPFARLSLENHLKTSISSSSSKDGSCLERQL
ncbi:polyamine transporter 1 [Echria macrotheca]|uniref:Polyamine transporter 1 n=1 Tax=Echria macrotheca TaxID=438768 RepID=A0AAJ0BK99_9PEZI|nr:polyamine transporter 1 [Echria macrotheca]